MSTIDTSSWHGASEIAKILQIPVLPPPHRNALACLAEYHLYLMPYRINIALRLKGRSNYAMKKDIAGQKRWFYSPLAADLLRDFVRAFPEVTAAISSGLHVDADETSPDQNINEWVLGISEEMAKQAGKWVAAHTHTAPLPLRETGPSLTIADVMTHKSTGAQVDAPEVPAELHVSTVKFSKERETPKRKKPTPMRRAIMEEKSKRGEQAGQPTSSVRRTYCRQVLDTDLDKLISTTLGLLLGFQMRAKEQNPANAYRTKRLVAGLKECNRAVERGICKLLIISPDIEKVSELDNAVEILLNNCTENEIPVVFGLDRRKLGRALRRWKNAVSSVAVVSADGAHDDVKRIITRARELQDQWEAANVTVEDKL